MTTRLQVFDKSVAHIVVIALAVVSALHSVNAMDAYFTGKFMVVDNLFGSIVVNMFLFGPLVMGVFTLLSVLLGRVLHRRTPFISVVLLILYTLIAAVGSAAFALFDKGTRVFEMTFGNQAVVVAGVAAVLACYATLVRFHHMYDPRTLRPRA